MPQEALTPTHAFSHVPVLHPACFYDDANGTFNYIVTGDVGDYLARYHADAAYVGAKGIQLATRETGTVPGDLLSIRRSIPLHPSLRVRLQLMYTQALDAPQDAVYLYFYYNDGDNQWCPELRLFNVDHKVYYAANMRATYTDTGLTFLHPDHYWNLIDWTFDLAAGRFDHLRVNGQLLDMSDIAIPSAAVPGVVSLWAYIEIKAIAGSHAHSYFDQILITAEER